MYSYLVSDSVVGIHHGSKIIEYVLHACPSVVHINFNTLILNLSYDIVFSLVNYNRVPISLPTSIISVVENILS